MKKLGIIIGVVLLALVFGYWFTIPDDHNQKPDDSTQSDFNRIIVTNSPVKSSTYFGEALLEGYGSGSPENDLRKMHSLMQNYRVLAKSLEARHFSSNADFAAALRGEKRVALAALPNDHSIFNEEGLVVDRWRTPLFFHMESAQKVSIHSAGPDTILGTEDDYSLIDGTASQSNADF